MFNPQGLKALLASLVLISSSIWAQGSTLEPSDITKVMGHIFEYHVDKKEISPAILKRSLNVYINNFDPERVYLLKSEVARFTEPDQAFLARMMREYVQHDLTVYEELDAVIRKAILRNRALRRELYQGIYAMVRAKEDVPDASLYPHPRFLSDVPALKERVRERLSRFIKLQRQKLGKGALEGKENRLVSLYEKTLVGEENDYLNQDDEGNPLTASENTHEVTLRVLKALAKSLDSHTAYFSPEEAYEMKVRLEKGFHGIGIVLQEGIDGVTVSRLLDGGPAKRSKLIEEKDRIVEIDGTNVENLSFEAVLEKIRGEEGSVVTLGLRRSLEDGNEKFFNVQLRRENIVMNDSRVDVSHEQVDGGIIGTIVLHAFYEGDNGINSERDIRNAIRDLYSEGNLKGLVLDLRDNTGGFLMQAVKVAGLFITNGVVVVSKYSDGQIRYFRDIDGHSYYDGPLVILTSRASASAAEIVAQTLQDYGRAIIVGDDRTYGKGSIQHQTITGNGSDDFFKVTVGRYYTVSGKSTQMKGVIADIVVPTEFNSENIGEKYLDYPLSADAIPASYSDSLSDIDLAARRWYLKYYSPTLQARSNSYLALLPELKDRSQKRLQKSQDFQAFLRVTKGEGPRDDQEEARFKELLAKTAGNDLPLEEAKNILKDIIVLSPNTGSMDALFTGRDEPAKASTQDN